GRVEQIGTPDELYDQPANDFVMTFLGPVTTLGGLPVRPHDIEILEFPEHGSVPATVARLVRLGFEVRVDAVTGDDEGVWVQVTRAEADRLRLEPGSVIFLRPITASAPSPTLAGSCWLRRAVVYCIGDGGASPGANGGRRRGVPRRRDSGRIVREPISSE